jgi:hypothetical protein
MDNLKYVTFYNACVNILGVTFRNDYGKNFVVFILANNAIQYYNSIKLRKINLFKILCKNRLFPIGRHFHRKSRNVMTFNFSQLYSVIIIYNNDNIKLEEG